jgi:hypothetical protein
MPVDSCPSPMIHTRSEADAIKFRAVWLATAPARRCTSGYQLLAMNQCRATRDTLAALRVARPCVHVPRWGKGQPFTGCFPKRSAPRSAAEDRGCHSGQAGAGREPQEAHCAFEARPASAPHRTDERIAIGLGDRVADRDGSSPKLRPPRVPAVD